MVNLANVVDCQRISSFRTLLRVTAHVLRFLERRRGSPLKVFKVEYSTVELEAAELERAEMLWIRSIQAEAFCQVLGEQFTLW